MKKFFKVLIPIILVIAIIACIGWYLFIYDRDFTRDMLLHAARFFDDQGNHSVSGWFYDKAYEQADNNDAVAIELAAQHVSNGNYTKAEYTLTRAISDGGSTDLYVALCKTYAEQDKLLDVVKLLDAVLSDESTVDAQVKQELQALRPAAPVTSPAPGFYNQYIEATVTCETGTLYVNADGVYPSVKDEPNTAPIELGDGENTIYAISLADNGLVSPLSVFGYTIGGVIKEVQFADAAMEEAIRLHLGVSADQVLYTNDLWELTYFTVPSNAKDISDLNYLTFVEDLAIDGLSAGQLGNLSSMVNLVSLQIRNTAVNAAELELIGSLPKLEQLTISNCSLATVSGLEKAEKLVTLDLSQNAIRDLTPLAGMVSLREASLQNNAIENLAPLSTLENLTYLDASYNLLSSVTPVFNCTSLTGLNLSNNTFDSVVGIEKLTELSSLYIANNKLEDISPLASCTKLQELDLSNNAISDISALSSLTEMTDLNFSRNAVTKLPAFDADCSLVTIDGSNNKISSLSPLKGLKHLNNVFMDYNAKLSSVAPLANCRRLVQVKVYGTKVKDVSVLLEMDVIVEFDPTLAM